MLLIVPCQLSIVLLANVCKEGTMADSKRKMNKAKMTLAEKKGELKGRMQQMKQDITERSANEE